MSQFDCLEAVAFASNTSRQDVKEAPGWSELGLERTKASLGLHSEPSIHLALHQRFGGVMLWVSSALLSALTTFCFSISGSQGEASLPSGQICSGPRDYQMSSHSRRRRRGGRVCNHCSPSRNLGADDSPGGSLTLHESEPKAKRVVKSAAE